MPNPRPRYLNLFEIRLPVPAFVSIVHRVTGAALFLLIPFLLYLLEASLASPERFGELKGVVAHPVIKLGLIGIIWAYLHHFCAGVRHLALDLHYGVGLEAARASSWAVLVVSIVLTLALGVVIW